MTPEQEIARKKKAVSAARALLSLEHGLVYGSKRMRDVLSLLGDKVPDEFPAFARFLNAIPVTTPTGELRLLCQEQLLFRSDAVLALVEAEFRQSLLKECLAVIKAYG